MTRRYSNLSVHSSKEAHRSSMSAGGSVSFLGIRLGGGGATVHGDSRRQGTQRSENDGVDTIWELQNPVAAANFPGTVNQDGVKLLEDLKAYVARNSSLILSLKTLGALAMKSGIQLVKEGNYDWINAADASDLLRKLTSISFLGEQTVVLCETRQYAEAHFSSLQHDQGSSGENGSQRAGADFSFIFSFGAHAGNSSRDDASHDNLDSAKETRLAHVTQDCKSSLNTVAADISGSAMAVDFTHLDRVLADWEKAFQSQPGISVTCNWRGICFEY